MGYLLVMGLSRKNSGGDCKLIFLGTVGIISCRFFVCLRDLYRHISQLKILSLRMLMTTVFSDFYLANPIAPL